MRRFITFFMTLIFVTIIWLNYSYYQKQIQWLDTEIGQQNQQLRLNCWLNNRRKNTNETDTLHASNKNIENTLSNDYNIICARIVYQAKQNSLQIIPLHTPHLMNTSNTKVKQNKWYSQKPKIPGAIRIKNQNLDFLLKKNPNMPLWIFYSPGEGTDKLQPLKNFIVKHPHRRFYITLQGLEWSLYNLKIANAQSVYLFSNLKLVSLLYQSRLTRFFIPRNATIALMPQKNQHQNPDFQQDLQTYLTKEFMRMGHSVWTLETNKF